MTMNSSGKISLGGDAAGESINKELNDSPTKMVSLNDAPVRKLATILSGAIQMPTDFYGKSNTVNIVVDFTTNTANAEVNIATLSGYVVGKTKVTVNIAQDILMYSTSIGNAGLRLAGGIAGDEILVNNRGFIIGAGGTGGAGAYVPGNSVQDYPGNPGGTGGLALNMTCPVGINNYNTIGGGGGGGASGRGNSNRNGFLSIYIDNYGGGGGGGGQSFGALGKGGVAASNGGNPCPPGSNGATGTITAGGGGGGGGGQYGTAGAAGGLFGVAGTPASGTGGASGAAIYKNGNVLTLYIEGTIKGAVI